MTLNSSRALALSGASPGEASSSPKALSALSHGLQLRCRSGGATESYGRRAELYEALFSLSSALGLGVTQDGAALSCTEGRSSCHIVCDSIVTMIGEALVCSCQDDAFIPVDEDPVAAAKRLQPVTVLVHVLRLA